MALKEALNKKDIPSTPRYQRILNLPGQTWLWDISTGDQFQRSQIYWTPEISGNFKDKPPRYFIVRPSKQICDPVEVPISFIRQLEDGLYCSLMKK